MPRERSDSISGTQLLRRAGGLTRQVRRCRLRVVSGPDAPCEVELGQRVISVGTHHDCDLVLTDASVSRRHLEIALEQGGFALRDLGSTNGTRVGALCVREVVAAGAVTIALGESALELTPLDVVDEAVSEVADTLVDLIGASPAMQEVFHLISRAAATDATVLITGETGTGKELAAEAIHQLSRRAGGPFVVVDCSAVPRSLFESELFGHSRGAFTGAIADHVGAFERAQGGTLFFDEVLELDPALQPKLLRALEQRRIKRLGADQETEVDVRVVVASQRDLADEVRHGRFRDDLYYRLAVLRVDLPPLRDRPEDIPRLATHFIQQALELPAGTAPPELADYLSPQAMDRLLAHRWPGNVRQLRNAVERAVLAGVEPITEPDHQSGAPEPAGGTAELPFALAKRQAVAAFERGYLEQLLARHQGNVSACARAADMDRRNFQRMLRRHALAR